MSYRVTAEDAKQLSLNETDIVKSVLQNIALILATPKGSLPMYRDFGLSWGFLDKPIPVAKVLMVSETKESVERWEPRATVLNLDFTENPERPGALLPVVEVDISRE